jgi:hypothetical protein
MVSKFLRTGPSHGAESHPSQTEERQQIISERLSVRFSQKLNRSYLTVGKVKIQEIAESVNKMKRSFILT